MRYLETNFMPNKISLLLFFILLVSSKILTKVYRFFSIIAIGAENSELGKLQIESVLFLVYHSPLSR